MWSKVTKAIYTSKQSNIYFKINVNDPIIVFTAKRYMLTPWQFTASGDWLRKGSTIANIKKYFKWLLSHC